MKVIFLTLTFGLTTMLTFGQTSGHLTFKDVPINGTLSDFVAKLKKGGVTYISTKDGIAQFKGEFAEYKDCTIYVVLQKKISI